MNKLLPQLLKIINFFKRYIVLICMVIFGAMYGYLIFTAGQQANLQPSDTAINDAYKANNRPKLDASVAETLRQLEAQNIEVQSLFNQARNNPFSE